MLNDLTTPFSASAPFVITEPVRDRDRGTPDDVVVDVLEVSEVSPFVSLTATPPTFPY